jgi:hypothetical protein
MGHLSRARLTVSVAVLTFILGAAWWLATAGQQSPDAASMSRPVEKQAANKTPSRDKRIVSDEQRRALLQRAQVWRAVQKPIAPAAFAVENLEEVKCRFVIDDLGGTTPKFDCELETGEEVRIKYGNGPEALGEVAATRLLRALGFGADRVTLAQRVRCYGCPKEPFTVMKTVELVRADALLERIVNYDNYEDFEWVALERKMNARPIQTESLEGWAFFELDAVQRDTGGAPRAHIDGLRMMAVLLAHWDNKSENQRMVCLSRDWPEDAACAEPFLLLQDVGATFGPTKMDFESWARVPMWDDRASCTVSMQSLPYDGATFGRATITEAGRQFIGGLLSQLSDDELTALLTSARFGEKRGLMMTVTPVSDWVRMFQQKVRLITDGPACPEP